MSVISENKKTRLVVCFLKMGCLAAGGERRVCRSKSMGPLSAMNAFLPCLFHMGPCKRKTVRRILHAGHISLGRGVYMEA